MSGTVVVFVVCSNVLCDKKNCKRFCHKRVYYAKNLQPFERDRTDVPSKEQANAKIRSLVEEDQTNEFMNQAFILGGALFTASLNCICSETKRVC